MMDAIENLPAFLAVAEERSFTRAANRMGLSRSAAGKAIARLEHRLGLALFKRSTRRVDLTEAGEILLERARAFRDDWQITEALLAESQGAPRGRLRLALPAVGHRLVCPHLPGFLARYPQVSIDLEQDDRFADLTTTGIDVAIRSGRLDDATHRSRLLTSFRFLLCAAPSYLERQGTPTKASHLKDHAQIRFRFPAGERLQPWRLNGTDDAVEAAPAFVSTNMEGVLAATCEGFGIAQLPDFLAARDIEAGRLRVVLADENVASDFWLIWQQHLHRTPKVRAIVDYLVAQFAQKSQQLGAPPSS